MTPSSPKFVYFGTPYVASETLATLLSAGYVPSLVVTAPDRERGRGQHVAPCETKEFAISKNLSVYSPEKLTSEAIEKIVSENATYAIVVAYGKMLPSSLLNSFPKGVLNVHYSLLPKYRGASPVEAALLHGDSVTGVSIQKMVKEMDAGDVLLEHIVPINDTETTRELRPRLIRDGAELLIKALPGYLAGELLGTQQNESEATFCKKIEKSEGELDLGGDQLMNWRKYRAFAESPGTYFFLNRSGKRIRVKIKTASFDGVRFTPLRVVPEGKKEMDFSSIG